MILIKGLIFYFLILLISILTGRGVLRLLGLRLESRISLFLSPLAAMVFWVLLLGWGVTFHYPVKDISFVGWILTAILMAVELWRGRWQSFCLKENRLWLGVVTLLPVCLMAPFFIHGVSIYLGSLAPDGWSYMAYARYLWEYPRGTEGGLAPLYQYAAHLNQTRFMASALLGFFSPVLGTAGDPQTVSGYFLAWTFFIFSSACMFFAVVKNLDKRPSLFYITLCVFSGWLLNLLFANNFDNSLAIPFLPAFAGVLSLKEIKQKRWGIFLAGLIAAVLYCYPEMAFFILGGSFFLLISRIVSQKESLKDWAILLLTALSLGVVLIAPFGKDMVWFIKNQLSSVTATQGARPGDNFFRELLSLKFGLGGFWGFGGDFSAATKMLGSSWSFLFKIWNYSRSLIGLALSLAAFLGIFYLIKRREWGMVALIIFYLFGSFFMIFHSAYSYGAYKFILLNWWAMSLAVVSGIEYLSARNPLRQKRIMSFSFFILLCFISVNGLRVISFNTIFSQTIVPFKKLEEVKRIVGKEPLIVAVDEDLANQWSVYFLRDLSTYFTEYRSYMAQSHVLPLMERAKPVNISHVSYLLTDNTGLFSFSANKPVWAGGPYSLWKELNKNWILVSIQRNANGIEVWGGERAFWMGQGDTELMILAPRAGRTLIRAWFTPGPSLPDKPDRRILIRTKGYEAQFTITKDGPDSFTVPVIEGMNRVFLRALDKPTLAVLPSGEARPLLIGVRGLKIDFSDKDHEY